MFGSIFYASVGLDSFYLRHRPMQVHFLSATINLDTWFMWPATDRPGSSYEHASGRGKLCRLPVSIIIHPPPTITTTIIYMSKELLCEKVQQFSLYICLPITSPYPILPCHSPLTWVVLPVLLIKMINITSDWNLKRKYCELHQLMLVCCCGGWAASKAVYVADLLPMRTISLYLKCNAMW